MTMHADQLHVDAQTVCRLVAVQFPQWRGLPTLSRELGYGDVQWRRGMAWAFQRAMGLVWYYGDSNPTMSQWGTRTLDRIEAELSADLPRRS